MQRVSKIRPSTPSKLKRDPFPKPRQKKVTYWFEIIYYVKEKYWRDAVKFSKFSTKEFALHDGNKVIGYAIKGRFYNYRRFYA